MRLDRALAALEILKPICGSIPTVGPVLEGIIDVLQHCRQAVEEVKSNKAQSISLADRAVRCVAVIADKSQTMPTEAMVSQLSSVMELDHLIRDILQSTKRRVEQSRLARLLNKDKDKEEIEELCRRLNEVIERFGVEAHMVTVTSLASLLDNITQIQDSQNITETNALLETLCPAYSAFRDHDNAPSGCAKDTRVDIVDTMVKWAGLTVDECAVYWLAGLAGTGKTAIMRTVSDRLAQLGLLAGCFFISRAATSRRDPQSVVRSLAHQLARFNSAFRDCLCSTLRQNPDIVHQSITTQAALLLAEPMAALARSIDNPVVLMLDALDECDKKDGVEGGQLLPLLIEVVRSNSTKIKLIITSRSETTIQSMFDKIEASTVKLHEIESTIVRGDIERYLRVSLGDIAQRRGVDNAAQWPPSEIIDALVDRAGNLFIFAATVVLYVSSLRHVPTKRLEEILARDSRSNVHSPYKALDELYCQILDTALGAEASEHQEISTRLRTLLGSLIVLETPLSVEALATLMALDPDVTQLDLEALSAVVLIPERGTTGPVTIFHASFEDFLEDGSRCPPRFLVDRWESNGHVAICSLELFRHDYIDEPQEERVHKDTLNPHEIALNYAHANWREHTRLAPTEIVQKGVDLCQYMRSRRGREHPDYWRFLGWYAYALNQYCERAGGVDLLKEVVAVQRQFLSRERTGNEGYDTSLNNLAFALSSLYDQTGERELLTEAIQLHREALRSRPPGHPSRDFSLNNLADALQDFFDETSDCTLLTEAITLHREALTLRPRDHPSRDASLNNLARALWNMFNENNEPELLTEAIQLFRETLKLHPFGHPMRSASLNNLAFALEGEYQRSQNVGALNEAIQLYKEAVNLADPTHPNTIFYQQHLSRALELSQPSRLAAPTRD